MQEPKNADCRQHHPLRYCECTNFLEEEEEDEEINEEKEEEERHDV
jgi:hypothetical protein